MTAAAPDPPTGYSRGVQGTFDELGTPLRDVTFVVVDLETTGGSRRRQAITEIGAVKVRGGEVLGEFATLVDPGRADPAVHHRAHRHHRRDGRRRAPRIGRRCCPPSWSSLARRRAGRAQRAVRRGLPQGGVRGARATPWPGLPVVDTARLARRVLTRDEVPELQAEHAGPVLPVRHRRPTTARWPTPGPPSTCCTACSSGWAPSGVHSLEELETFSVRVSPQQRRKRHLADALPHAPGRLRVRATRPAGSLYVGKSTRPAHPGPHLLHRLARPADPDGRDGRPRRARDARSSAPPRWRPRSASCG